MSEIEENEGVKRASEGLRTSTRTSGGDKRDDAENREETIADENEINKRDE